MGLLPARYSDNIVDGRNPLSLSWRAAWISVFLGVTAVVAFYWDTATQMVHIWSTSASFNHGFLIFPICGYLIWLKRATLATMIPQPSVWGLGVVLGASLCWLMGFVASVALVQQFAFVIVIQGIFLAVLGLKIGKRLLFPLAYMLFAVPFGRFMIPPLQDVTAFFVVKGLRLIEVPVFLDGIFISIPTGNFEVAEACSGVRFLIATIALGTLFAYITYQSRMRQFAFVGLSIVVPIVANGIRAFGIVLIAYLSDNEFAVGVDHIFYGWVFFAIITVVLLLIGMTFHDGDTTEPVVDVDAVRRAAASAVDQKKILTIAAIGVMASTLAPVYADHMASRAIPAINGELPVPAVGKGWQLARDSNSDWSAVYPDAHAQLQRRYVKGPSQVDLYIAYYTSQRQGAELVSSRNAVSDLKIWSRAASTSVAVQIDGEEKSVHRVRMLRNLSGKRITYQWYWIGGQFTSNPYLAKFLQVMNQLLSGEEASASIVISARYDEMPISADRILQEFLTSLQPLSPLLQSVSRQ
jgi:exosortase A